MSENQAGRRRDESELPPNNISDVYALELREIFFVLAEHQAGHFLYLG